MPYAAKPEVKAALYKYWDEFGSRTPTYNEVLEKITELKTSLKTYYKHRAIYERGQNGDLGKEFEEWLAKIKAAGEGGKNANYARLYAQIKGYLEGNKQDETNELSPSEYIRIARETRSALQEELRDCGVCPVCLQRLPLYEEPCLDTEREQGRDSEVAAVGVPD